MIGTPSVRRTFAGVSLLAAGACAPALANAADLLDIYHEALVHDAQFASSRSSLTAGREKAPQGLSLLLPQISGTASESRVNVQASEPAPFGAVAATFNQRAYTLSLSQPIFRWANYQQYQQGKLSVMLSEAVFAQAQEDLIIRVVQAYTDVLYARDSIEYTHAQKEAITEQLASAKRNFEVGTFTVTDVDEAQARYDLADSQEIAAKNQLDIANAALQQIIGREAGALVPLRRGAELPPPEPLDISTWASAAERQNFTVAQGQANYEIAKREIQVGRSGHYPTVDLVASRSYQNGGAIISGVNSQVSNSVGVQLSIPIFSGGFTSSKVREDIALAEKAENDLDFAKRSASQSARTSYFGVTSGLAQIKALQSAERSSQTALDSNKLAYQVGVRTNIDVLNAQQQLYSTQRDLARARYDVVLNALRLKSAAGTLAETDLAGLNMLLER
jgi:outer membrane protein